MEKEFEVISVEPFVDVTPEGKFVKKYRIRLKILGKFEDWVEVSEDEFVNQLYLDKIKKLVEAYKI